MRKRIGCVCSLCSKIRRISSNSIGSRTWPKPIEALIAIVRPKHCSNAGCARSLILCQKPDEPPDDEEQALCASLLQRLENIDPYRILKPHFDAVYEAPNDVEPKAVLSDALIELGDARGEFIAYQLSNQLRNEEDPKTAELQKRGRRAFLAPFERVVLESTAKFEAGFLSRACLDGLEKVHCEALVGRKEWSTLRHLCVHRWTGDLRSLLGAPSMRSLKTLMGVEPRHLSEDLCQHLEALTLKLGSRILELPICSHLKVLELAGNVAIADAEYVFSWHQEALRRLIIHAEDDYSTWLSWALHQFWDRPIEINYGYGGPIFVVDGTRLLVRHGTALCFKIMKVSLPLHTHVVLDEIRGKRIERVELPASERCEQTPDPSAQTRFWIIGSD